MTHGICALIEERRMTQAVENPIRSWGLVGAQFSLLIALVLLTRWDSQCWLCWGLLLSGVALGGWAVLSIGIGNFNVVPDVKQDARLVHTRLPYRWIRHPMYSSLLLLSTGLVLSHFHWLNALIGIALFMVLNLKAAYEEALLCQRFDDYPAYRQRSKRFIPFVY